MINVIIPTYKARDTLPNALDSLVAQTKKLFVVTIVQDCDGEDYTDIINEYRRRGLKIRLLQTPSNGGPGNARQFGMDNDNMCEYFMFLDADDMYFPRAIEILSKEAKIHNADIVVSTFLAEQNHQPALTLNAQTTPVTWTHGKIYKAEYLRKNNIRFLPELRLNEDSYFNLVAVNCASNKFQIQEPTYLWRDNANSLTRNKENDTFFSRSWEMYIYSQVEGIRSIERITGTIDSGLLAATLNNMYTHIMEAIYRNYPVDYAKQLCLQLKNSPALLNALNDKKFWEMIHQVVKGTILKDNTLIFMKMRFCDWLNEFVLNKEKE